MAYYADGTGCTYFGRGPETVAIGWLDSAHPFESGPVSDEVMHAMAVLVQRSLSLRHYRGIHECSFCNRDGVTLEVGEISLFLGASNIFVPSAEVVYAAPSLILHYVRDHTYAPPLEFQRAAEASARTTREEWIDALRARGFNDRELELCMEMWSAGQGQ